jgi:hypothetical protein
MTRAIPFCSVLEMLSFYLPTLGLLKGAFSKSFCISANVVLGKKSCTCTKKTQERVGFAPRRASTHETFNLKLRLWKPHKKLPEVSIEVCTTDDEKMMMNIN